MLKNNETENLWLTNNLFRVNSLGTGEMAQQVRGLAALVEDLSSAPSTHIRHRPINPVPGDSQAPAHKLMQVHTHTHKRKYYINPEKH